MSPEQEAAPRVMVLIASTRPGRLGPAVARWFLGASAADDVAVRMDLTDLAEVGLPMLDEPEHPAGGVYQHEHTRRWSARVAAADAFVVVTPEYNYGMPAVLKNALDYLYAEWAWKPVGFISYGNTSAGTRSVQMAKQVMTTLRMVPIGATVALRIADTVADGEVRADVAPAAARAVLTELLRVTAALRPLRAPVVAGAPVSGLSLTPATAADSAELLVLQRCCWVQEAMVNDSLGIPALHETLDDVRAWVASWQVWTVRQGGRLVAAVRARAAGDATWEIGRLMVAPDLAGRGIGRWLLAHAESRAPRGATGYTLVTGARSFRNIDLYQRAGYRITAAPPEAGIVGLSKEPPA